MESICTEGVPSPEAMTRGMFRIAGLLGTVLFISGCMVKPYVLTQDDVQTRVAKDLETVSALQEPCPGRSTSMKRLPGR